jgi:hypothetical protein
MIETKTTEVKNLYSDRANERRKQFNNIINGCNMILQNKIVDVDPEIWESWESDTSPLTACEINDETGECDYHGEKLEDGECPYSDEMVEVYQWFAVGDNDADFLKRHGQYITYSDAIDTYYLAICHFGTSWDYVDSMVEAFSDCYHGLEDFSDEKK